MGAVATPVQGMSRSRELSLFLFTVQHTDTISITSPSASQYGSRIKPRLFISKTFNVLSKMRKYARASHRCLGYRHDCFWRVGRREDLAGFIDDVQKCAADGKGNAPGDEENKPGGEETDDQSKKRPEEYLFAPGVDVDGKGYLELVLFQGQPVAEAFNLSGGFCLGLYETR